MKYGKILASQEETTRSNFKITKAELEEWKLKAASMEMSVAEMIRQAVRAYK